MILSIRNQVITQHLFNITQDARDPFSPYQIIIIIRIKRPRIYRLSHKMTFIKYSPIDEDKPMAIKS